MSRQVPRHSATSDASQAQPVLANSKVTYNMADGLVAQPGLVRRGFPDMTGSLTDNDDVRAWVNQQKGQFSQSNAFGEIKSAVVWTNDLGEDGNLRVSVDPRIIVEEINTGGMQMLRDHDPGAPAGRFLAAKVFTAPGGITFVAAIAGFYTDATRVTFGALGLDPAPSAPSPPALDLLHADCQIIVAADPREVEPEWLDSVLIDAPLGINRIDSSHNAAESVSELIRFGLPYALLVWNPLVTSVATEAGKEVYAGVRKWFRNFFGRLAERRNPIVELQSSQQGCRVSFLFRGNDVQRNYAAHDAQPSAAAQAAQLISNMNARGTPPRTLTYEFEPNDKRWFPSYAELKDGRIVTDRNILIAAEQLPSGLSLGLVKSRDAPRLR